MGSIGSWAYHIFGIKGSGPWYSFWSGIGSDIGELAILGSMWEIYHKHNCHVHWCPRIGSYPVDGTVYVLCRRHHPEVPNKPQKLDVILNGHYTPHQEKVSTG